MHYDFYVAFVLGWAILLLFWSITILFVYLRKPPNSRLSRKIIINSYGAFLIFFVLIWLVRNVDSFF